jgi:uncharacterized protein
MLAPFVTLGPSAINGLGLISRASISLGVIVWHPSSECAIWTEAELSELQPQAFDWLDEFGYRLSDGSILAGADCGYAFNHSCDPNVLHFGLDFGIAVRSIQAGEELTIDYRALSEERDWSFACRCGMEVCAGNISATRIPSVELREAWSRRIAAALLLAAIRDQPLRASLLAESRSYITWAETGQYAVGDYSVTDPRISLAIPRKMAFLDREMRRIQLQRNKRPATAPSQ